MLWHSEGNSYRQICVKNRNKLSANEVFSQRVVIDRRKTWTKGQMNLSQFQMARIFRV